MKYPYLVVKITEYANLIPLLNAKSTYNIFTDNKTHLKNAQLPFFNNYCLLSAQTFSTIPPVTMSYLWNEQNNDIIKLNGTRDAVFDNLDKLGLTLNQENIVPYVRFVLDNVWNDKGSLRLVEIMDEIEFSDKPSKSDLRFLERAIRPTIVTQTEEGFILDTIIIYGTEVYQSSIAVAKNGTFDIQSETELINGMSCLRVIFLE